MPIEREVCGWLKSTWINSKMQLKSTAFPRKRIKFAPVKSLMQNPIKGRESMKREVTFMDIFEVHPWVVDPSQTQIN